MKSEEIQFGDRYTYHTLSKHIVRSWGFSILLFFYYLYKFIFDGIDLMNAIMCFVLIIIIFSLSLLSRDFKETYRYNKVTKIGGLKMILYDFGLIIFLGILSFYLFFYKGVYGMIMVFFDLSGWKFVLGVIKKIVIIYLAYQFVVSVDKVQTIKNYFEKENHET